MGKSFREKNKFKFAFFKKYENLAFYEIFAIFREIVVIFFLAKFQITSDFLYLKSLRSLLTYHPLWVALYVWCIGHT